MFRTVSNAVTFRGVGLHCGQPVAATVLPAAAGEGVAFRGAEGQQVAARFDRVVETRYRTSLGDAAGQVAGTVEHLLAALAGCGISDACVVLDGEEVPALDGSASGFVRGLFQAGFRDTPGTRQAIRILEPVFVHLEGRSAALVPATRPEMHFTVRFSDTAIGSQTRDMVLTPQSILGELCDCRTFSLLSDVQMLRGLGLARGGGLDNAIVVDRGRVLNHEGLRHPDEFVRHKMLDAVGDLVLAGAPIIGRYVGFKAGHEVTNLLLHRLFTEPAAWEWCDAPEGGLPVLPPQAPSVHIAPVPAAV